MTLKRVRASATKVSATPPPGPSLPSAEDRALLGEVLEHFRKELAETLAAQDYLVRRGLDSADMVEAFKLGYSARTIVVGLPPKGTKPGDEQRKRLEDVGILRHGGHETFSSMLVVPIFDAEGHLAQAYGRRISPPPGRSTRTEAYLPGPRHGVLNYEGLKEQAEVILCDDPLDALTFWAAGYRNVTSTHGLEEVTSELLEAFKTNGTQRVLLAHPRDPRADKVALKLAKQLKAVGIGAYRVEFPKRMTANSYSIRMKPAAKSLGLVIKNARWLGDEPAPDRPAVPLPVTPTPPRAAPAPAPKRPKALPRPPRKVDETRPVEPVQPATGAPVVGEADDGGRSRIIAAAAPPCEPEPAAEPLAEPAPDPTPPPPPVGPPVEVTVKADGVELWCGERRYRVRGLEKNLAYDVLRVNLLAARGDTFHVDAVDLYNAKARTAFAKQAAAELAIEEDVVRRDLGKVLLKLEALQEENIQRTLAPKKPEPKMTPAEEAEALELLRDPKLVDRVLADFERCGVTGETTNKLVGFLAAVSRKLEDPLAVIIQSTSAAGKSALMESILAFVPPEDRVKYAALTPRSIYYAGEVSLRHKVLAVVEEEGADSASYALKLLQSEKELTIASTGRDTTTGKLVTQEYSVRGPTSLFLTTTSIDIDEELLNRALVLTVDEDRDQTAAIHRLQRQRETLAGAVRRHAREGILRKQQNAQRLLRPLLVVNPYAEELTFLDNRTRARRDHMKYLGLIRAIALLHQHQRPVRTFKDESDVVEYIEVTLDDIALANQLAHKVLGRSLDELAPQTRTLLIQLDRMATEACEKRQIARKDYRFGRREIREYTGWSYDQVRVHLERLLAMEHVLLSSGGRGQTHTYELVYDGKALAGEPHLAGLIDVEELRAKTLGAEDGTLGDTGRGSGVALGGRRGPAGGPSVVAEVNISANGHEDLAYERGAETVPSGTRPRREAADRDLALAVGGEA